MSTSNKEAVERLPEFGEKAAQKRWLEEHYPRRPGEKSPLLQYLKDRRAHGLSDGQMHLRLTFFEWRCFRMAHQVKSVRHPGLNDEKTLYPEYNELYGVLGAEEEAKTESTVMYEVWRETARHDSPDKWYKDEAEAEAAEAAEAAEKEKASSKKKASEARATTEARKSSKKKEKKTKTKKKASSSNKTKRLAFQQSPARPPNALTARQQALRKRNADAALRKHATV